MAIESHDERNGIDGIPENNERDDVAVDGAPESVNGARDPESDIKRPRPDIGVKRRPYKKRGVPSDGSGKPNANTASSEQNGAPRKSASDKKLDLSALAKQLQGGHQILALMLKNPMFAVSEDEAEKLAHAISDVMKLYSINLSPTVVAWVKLAAVASAIYGPKIIASNILAKQKKSQQQNPQPTQPVSSAPMPNGITGEVASSAFWQKPH